MASPDELVAQALDLAKAGDKAAARAMVIEALKADRDHLKGWWLAAQVAKNREEAIKCLQQVLRLSPGDARAKAAIERLQSEAAASPSPAQPPQAAPPAPPQPIRRLEPQRAPTSWEEAPRPSAAAPAPAAMYDDDDSWPKGLSRPGRPLQSSFDAPAPVPEPEATDWRRSSPPPQAGANDDSWRQGLGQSAQPAAIKAVATEQQAKPEGPNWLVIGAGVLVALCVVCGVGGMVINGMGSLGSLSPAGGGSGGGVTTFNDGYTTVGDSTISVGGSARATLNSLFDAYNVRFQAAQGQSYTIQVNGAGGCDPRATVYAPNGRSVAEGDDDNGYNALIRMTAGTAGEYVVRVDVWDAPCTFDVWVTTP